MRAPVITQPAGPAESCVSDAGVPDNGLRHVSLPMIVCTYYVCNRNRSRLNQMN